MAHTPAPHVRAAFINAIAEEGTKAEAVEFLQRQWNENCALRETNAAMLAALKAIVDSAFEHEREPQHSVSSDAIYAAWRVIAKAEAR